MSAYTPPDKIEMYAADQLAAAVADAHADCRRPGSSRASDAAERRQVERTEPDVRGDRGRDGSAMGPQRAI